MRKFLSSGFRARGVTVDSHLISLSLFPSFLLIIDLPWLGFARKIIKEQRSEIL